MWTSTNQIIDLYFVGFSRFCRTNSRGIWLSLSIHCVSTVYPTLKLIHCFTTIKRVYVHLHAQTHFHNFDSTYVLWFSKIEETWEIRTRNPCDLQAEKITENWTSSHDEDDSDNAKNNGKVFSIVFWLKRTGCNNLCFRLQSIEIKRNCATLS